MFGTGYRAHREDGRLGPEARASSGQRRTWLRNYLLELEEVQGRLASTWTMSLEQAQRIEVEAR